jgi:vitamin B12 transporter
VKQLALAAFCVISLCVLWAAPAAYAVSEEEHQALLLFFEEKELVVSPTRHAKPVSLVAENITVITAEDIEALNAHTLNDVLMFVPGVQVERHLGPGSVAHVYIQGSAYEHVLVLIDGVVQNNLADNITDVGALPVRNIERIEIIKGPASSAWGSSLGGVINIITKSPTESPHGSLSASYGERETGDFGAEASGRASWFGYYVFASHLRTDGLRPGAAARQKNFYSKLTAEISPRSDVYLTLGFNDGKRELGDFSSWDLSFDNTYEYLFSTLGVTSRPSEIVELDASAKFSTRLIGMERRQLSTGLSSGSFPSKDKVAGASAKVVVKPGGHTIVIGADYENSNLKSDSIAEGEQDLEELAFYVNDTIVSGRWSVTPGLRYDHASITGEFWSPSLGITFAPAAKTVLRLFVARGFNTPTLFARYGVGPFFDPNSDLEMEKAWSYQAGVETSALRYLWLKATLFRHDITDAITSEPLGGGRAKMVNGGKFRRQGLEVEARTAPVHGISLLAGFAFNDVEDRTTGETVDNAARYTWDLGADYKTESTRAALRGHYVWWNVAGSNGGKYNDFVWDLYVTRTLYKDPGKRLEGFMSARNIFNASQYSWMFYKNPPRWFDAGLRLEY